MPRASDGTPDLSGVWNANVDSNPAAPPLLPWAEKEWKQLANAQAVIPVATGQKLGAASSEGAR